MLTLPATAAFAATSNGPPNAPGFGWEEGEGAEVMLDWEDSVALLEEGEVVIEVSLLADDDGVGVSAVELSNPVDEGLY